MILIKKNLFKHELFDERNILNDIGLLILKKKAVLNNKIQLACLPQYSFDYPGTGCDGYAVGWGVKSNDSEIPEFQLNNVKLTIYNISSCESTGKDAVKNWDAQICAGDLSGNKSICYGELRNKRN